MIDPFKLTVLKTLTAALAEITIANGYQHDLTDPATGKIAVYRGRLLLTDAEPVPCLALNEPPQLPDEMFAPEGAPLVRTRHPLIIQGFVTDDQMNPTDPAYRLLADVQKRLSIERTRDEGFDMLGLGARITAFDIGTAVVRPPEATVSIHSLFWLPLTLGYVENLQNPFA